MGGCGRSSILSEEYRERIENLLSATPCELEMLRFTGQDIDVVISNNVSVCSKCQMGQRYVVPLTLPLPESMGLL